MNTRNSSNDQEKFKEAGEQAARVIGDFFSMADEFSRRLEKNFEHRGSPKSQNDANEYDAREHDTTANNHKEHNHKEQDFRTAKDYLHNLGDAAGSAIDGFASGLKADRDGDVNKDTNRRSAMWLDQAAELLKQRNPEEFFDKLRGYCEQSVSHPDQQDVNPEHGPVESLRDEPTTAEKNGRREKLNQLFADSDALDDLSDRQFDELLEFMKRNYESALQLVGKG